MMEQTLAREFSSWFTACIPEASDETIGKRLAGIADAVESLAFPERLPDVVRLFRNQPTDHSDSLKQFGETFWEQDRAFTPGSNSAEIRLLAGATLAQLASTPGPHQEATILAVTASGLCASTDDAHFQPIDRFMMDQLDAIAVEQRACALLEQPLVDTRGIATGIDTLLGSTSESDLDADLKATIDLVQKLTLAVGKPSGTLQSLQRCHRESSDVLWWVTGSRSRECNTRFSEMTVHDRCLVAARDLCQLSQFSMPLFASEAILDRVIGSGEPLSLEDAITEMATDRVKAWHGQLPAHPVRTLTPAWRALETVVTQGTEAATMALRAEVPNRVPIAPAKLAWQLHVEDRYLAAIDAWIEA